MDRKIILLGELGEKFGTEWFGRADTVADAFKLIDCQEEDFKPYILGALDAGLDAAIMIGDQILEDGVELNKITKDDIIIALIPAGSKSGFGKILAAIAIAIFAWYMGPIIFTQAATPTGTAATITGGGTGAISAGLQSALYAIAANLAVAGVTELLAKVPKTRDSEIEGSLFIGPTNTVKQGQPLPLLYGKLLIGGTPISVNFSGGNLPEQTGSIVTNTGVTTTSGGGNVSGSTDIVVTQNVNEGGGRGDRRSGPNPDRVVD